MNLAAFQKRTLKKYHLKKACKYYIEVIILSEKADTKVFFRKI